MRPADAVAVEGQQRTVGLFGATSVGVGAIVGGGIFVLAGVAFTATGPGAILAFGLNGVIALLTVLSFAEMSTAFPESGGAYAFGKRVLSIRSAFAIGWILWFAYVVAVVLYALGFASYAVLLLEPLGSQVWSDSPAWLSGRPMVLLLATLALGWSAVSLMGKATGGGVWITWSKVAVFAVLVAAGSWVLLGRPAGSVQSGLDPFLPAGPAGLFTAMGFTFIAIQGFDLIPAIGGEIKDPERNIPRSMLLSLGLALAIYLPLLLIVATVGVTDGETITSLSRENPETVMAVAAHNFLGPVGYWLVVVAAILATLSALQSNLLAASRIALTMGRDRTLPRVLGQVHKTRGTPTTAVVATSLLALVTLLAVPSLPAAGAAASLIFLISFALTHVASIRVRVYGGPRQRGYRTPFVPLVPVVGGLTCAALAVFQAVVVPAAGAVTAMWLAVGVLLYFVLFSSRAEAVDAMHEARDPDLVRLRGRNPLVLVPMANPATAPAMIDVANALATPDVGRVLVLSVFSPEVDENPFESSASIRSVEKILSQALTVSIESGHFPEVLFTIAARPWEEITRVAGERRCESLLLGFSALDDDRQEPEKLISQVKCDVCVLAAPPGWKLAQVRTVLVPIAGRGDQATLRARLIGTLCRTGDRLVTFLKVLPARATQAEYDQAEIELAKVCEDQAPGRATYRIERSDDVAAAIIDRAASSDLAILGIHRPSRKHRVFSEIALRVVRESQSASIIISRGP